MLSRDFTYFASHGQRPYREYFDDLIESQKKKKNACHHCLQKQSFPRFANRIKRSGERFCKVCKGKR